MRCIHILSFPVVMITVAGMAACGSSSSSGSSPVVAPQNTQATAGVGEFEATWDPVSDADGYNIYYATESGIDIDNPGVGGGQVVQDVSSPHTVSGVTNYETYYVVVTATRGSKESQASNEVSTRPAPGISGLERITTQASIAAGAYQRLVPQCPADKVVLSGGARVLDMDSAEPQTRVQMSSPATRTGQPVLWAVGISNEGAGEVDVEAYAICADEPDLYAIVEKNFTVPASGYDRTIISCSDPDQTAISGGFMADGGGGTEPGLRIQSSGSYYDAGFNHDFRAAWRVAASNTEATDNAATARVVCARPPRGFDNHTGDFGSVDPNEYVIFSTTCPQDQTVLGGGYTHSGTLNESPNTPLQHSAIETIVLVGDVWRNGFANTGGDTVNGVYARAVCAEEDN